MNKILTLVLVLAACAYADDSNSARSGDGSRQKRLLFFDEGGSLVKTYSNPYMNQLTENQNLPFYGNFLNPFFNFIRHFGNSLVAYSIPVSNAIIQSIQRDPSIQNTLVIIPKKDPLVAPNPLCEGKRTQIPAPNLCNNFLNCWDGWAFEQECPSGLLFSSNGYCDYADNVDCHNRKLDAEKPQPQPICKKDFEAFRNQQNCNEFFICVNRQPIRFKCPEDLAYSQILGVCDYADRVDCKSTGSQIGSAPQPSYPSPISPPSPAGPVIPASPAADSPIIPQETPELPGLPAIPTASPISTSPEIPTSPSIPTSPAFPTSPAIPEIPTIPASPVFPAFPIAPPQSPVIPPAPAAIPPLPSLLPPGSVFPSAIYPTQRPLPPAGVFPAPVPQLPNPGDKPGFPGNGIFTPGCSSANVAMSRQDAIRLLQQAISNNIAY